jgi:hypothetical protein
MTTMPTSVLMAMWSVGSTPRSENKENSRSYLKNVLGASFSFYFYLTEDQRMREFVRAFGSELTHTRALAWNSNYGNGNSDEKEGNEQYLHEITHAGERKIPVEVVGDEDVFGRKSLDDTSSYAYAKGNHTTMIAATGHAGIDSRIVGALSGHRADNHDTETLVEMMAAAELAREMSAVELDQDALVKYATHSVPSGSSFVSRSFIYARSPVIKGDAQSMVEEIGDTYIAVILEAESNNARNVRLCLLVDSGSCELTALALHYAFSEYREKYRKDAVSPKAQYTLYTGYGQAGVADKIKSAMQKVVRPGAAEKMVAEINSARGTTARSSPVSTEHDEYSPNTDSSDMQQSVSETADDTGSTHSSETAEEDRVRLADSFLNDGPGDSNPQADTSAPSSSTDKGNSIDRILSDLARNTEDASSFGARGSVSSRSVSSRSRWGKWI